MNFLTGKFMLCPICNNDYLIEGDYVDVGIGSVKCGPDHCEFCEYVEKGLDPFGLDFSHFEKCWELQIPPHPPAIISIRGEIPDKYRDFCENVTKTYGECYRTCIRMNDLFPELRIIKGTYYCCVWGARDHYWCLDENNVIVDPTATQFPSKGNGIYSDGVIVKKDALKEILKTINNHHENFQAIP